jgi:hypothetical protein
MAWSRRNFLRSSALTGLAFAPSAGSATGTGRPRAPRNLITVVAEGGWDVTHCFDPKLGVDSVEGPEIDETGAPDDVEAVQTFGEIDIVVNAVKRPSVTEWFTRWHSRAHVVNGVWMGAISHDPCRFRILTGTTLATNADLATIVGYARGEDEPLGSLDLSGWSLAGPLAASSGRVGFQNQIKTLVDPNTRVSPPDDASWSYPLFDMAPEDEGAVAAYLRARAEAFGAARGSSPTLGADGQRSQRVDDLLQSWSRGERFRTQSAEVLSNLVLGRPTGFADQVTIAVDLLETGLCRTVTLDSSLNWDTHERNVLQHQNYETLFDKLDLLASLLEVRGMLDDTLVAVVSEMTRTPKLNDALGKDHWPHTSALFFGGGIRGGVKSGATDELLESVTVDLQTGVPAEGGALLRYDNLVAGVLAHMDIDPAAWLGDVEPFRGFEA